MLKWGSAGDICFIWGDGERHSTSGGRGAIVRTSISFDDEAFSSPVLSKQKWGAGGGIETELDKIVPGGIFGRESEPAVMETAKKKDNVISCTTPTCTRNVYYENE